MTKEDKIFCVTPEFTIELVDKMAMHTMKWMKGIKIVDESNADEICDQCFRNIMISTFVDVLSRMIAALSIHNPEKLNRLLTSTIEGITVLVDAYSKQDITDKSTRRH